MDDMPTTEPIVFTEFKSYISNGPNLPFVNLKAGSLVEFRQFERLESYVSLNCFEFESFLAFISNEGQKKIFERQSLGIMGPYESGQHYISSTDTELQLWSAGNASEVIRFAPEALQQLKGKLGKATLYELNLIIIVHPINENSMNFIEITLCYYPHYFIFYFCRIIVRKMHIPDTCPVDDIFSHDTEPGVDSTELTQLLLPASPGGFP